MALLIRRSNLLVPMTHAQSVSQAWRHNADAITLDLEDGVVEARKAAVRELVKDAIGQAGRGAAEVFVRVNKPFVPPTLRPACGRACGVLCCPALRRPQRWQKPPTC
jgi:hypothetical protein